MADCTIVSGAGDTVGTDELFEDFASVTMVNNLNLSAESDSVAELASEVGDEDEILRVRTAFERGVTQVGV